MNKSIYDSIGKTYDLTRKADPAITNEIIKHLNIENENKYLDVACGTGNYTNALYNNGINIEGIDISKAMLTKARTKYPDIKWHDGDAHSLPFPDSQYDGIICSFATHHMNNIKQVFKEMFRVLNRGKVVILTATPEQMDHYWLYEYFPKMIKESGKKMMGFKELREALALNGFTNIRQELFFVPEDMQDLFLLAGKFRPEIYLDSTVRAGISAFQLLSCNAELKLGLQQLEQDIKSGKIYEIIKKYENSLGDYMFVTGEKP